jgi:hypothetical protein
VAALAFATFQPTEFNATNVEAIIGGANCTVTWASPAPHTVKVPSTPIDTSIGGASFWFFVYSDLSHALLMVVVTNGSAQPLLTATGGGCSDVAPILEPLSNTAIVDSSTAVSATNAKGGSTFLTDHPYANRTWAVIGEIPFYIQPTWFVNYSVCPVPPPPNSTATAPSFHSKVDAQTGTAVSWGNLTTVCTVSLPFKLPSDAPVSSPGPASTSSPPALPSPHPGGTLPGRAMYVGEPSSRPQRGHETDSALGKLFK